MDRTRMCGLGTGRMATWLFAVGLCAFAAAAQGANPAEQAVTVSNVAVAQHGAFLKVTYDLETSDGAPAHVSASLSEDGGATFTKFMRSTSGDINKDVSPGVGRWFAWNFSADGVSGLIGQARVRVQSLYPGMERQFGGIVFCWIPPGSFLMGRYPGEQDSHSNEDPQHEVTFAQGFWMSKYEVTQAQWRAVMAWYPGDNSAVVYVCWNDIRQANGYLDKLNAAHPGHGFRLPSEAEWEYAYRAGTQTRFYWGDDPDDTQIGQYAWYWGNNTPDGPKDVGGKLPNAWGLHDMAGNVCEWCEDCAEENYTGAPTDGSAWVDSQHKWYRVIRGGSWEYQWSGYRAADRNHYSPFCGSKYLGFRVVCSSD